MNKHDSSSEFLRHEHCPGCGSKDNLARYTDGHAYCFGCSYYEPSDSEGSKFTRKKEITISDDFTSYREAECEPLVVRGIDEETCRKFGVRVGNHQGAKVHFYPYYKDNTLVACKLRDKDKNFKVIGEGGKLPFFGQNLWGPSKMVVVTEGEIDCLSVSQVQGNKWATVSVPVGAQGASRTFRQQLEWLEQFESVIIMMDMDEPGQAAAKACAEVLSPGKAKIATLGMKDPNELLLAGRGQEIIKAIWNAQEYRPDGLVTLTEMKEKALVPPEIGYPWFLDTLTEATYGRRCGELYALGAGTGVGKTDFLTQQIEYDINTLKMSVATFFLEQSPVETVQRVAGKQAGKLFHIPGEASADELKAAIEVCEANGKMILYDNWGATDWDVIKSKIRFIAHSEGTKLFYVDHLTALAAGQSDERVELEGIMAEMATLCKELDIIITIVSHLATPDGKPHEEGGRVMIRHFKGSRAIGFWCHFMFGIERDQQSDESKNQSVFRILKDRHTGRSTGTTIPLFYDAKTGLLSEQPFAEEAYAF